MRKFKFIPFLFLTFVLAVAMIAGCAPKDKEVVKEKPKVEGPIKGGSLVIGYDQEPDILNPFIEGGDMMATAVVIRPVLQGLLEIKPDLTYGPQLAEKVPSFEDGTVTENPFTVTYKIKDEANWSDKTPITSEDVKFTWETIMNEDWKIITQTGYDKIEKIETPDDKTVKIVFTEPYAPWKDLFSGSYFILPKHALEGKDFNAVMNQEIPFSAGPFKFKEWRAGDSITLVRNENYWGEHAYLDSVTFKYIPETTTQLAQFKTGEVDFVYPPPDVDLLEQLEAVPNTVVSIEAGTVWEHIAFNNTNEHLKDVRVRQAVAHGIDRGVIAEDVMKGQVNPLHSFVVPEQKAYYVPAWEIYGHDAEKAESLLKEAGYTKGADGIYTKAGEKLKLTFNTTAGNVARERIQQIVQSDLKKIGIEVEIKNTEANTYFGTWLPNGEYQIGQWAWLATPDPTYTTLFAGDQIPPDGQNYYCYENDEVTKIWHDQDVTIDEPERVKLIKEAQNLMAKDCPFIPLYQRLEFIAYTDKLHGPVNNPTLQGPTWNMGEWWLEK
ncbi:MAG TPA: peptide ABC transporter substrate-binding protein [Actinobacteria bacterium]|nr:peptide ABC transporter substrate-binding protein [Actinomycetota bacterium]